MRPQIQQPGPGLCPLCGMELIPVRKGAQEDRGPRTLEMSEAGKRLAEIETIPVEHKYVTKNVRLVGKVDVDETRLAYITAWAMENGVVHFRSDIYGRDGVANYAMR